MILKKVTVKQIKKPKHTHQNDEGKKGETISTLG